MRKKWATSEPESRRPRNRSQGRTKERKRRKEKRREGIVVVHEEGNKSWTPSRCKCPPRRCGINDGMSRSVSQIHVPPVCRVIHSRLDLQVSRLRSKVFHSKNTTRCLPYTSISELEKRCEFLRGPRNRDACETHLMSPTRRLCEPSGACQRLSRDQILACGHRLHPYIAK